jgi:hypothetical protein
MAYTLGGNAVLYYSATTQRATWATAVVSTGLNIVRHVGDLTLDVDKNEEDVTTRDTPGFETSMMTLIKAGVSFKVIKDTADASYLALRNNFFSSSGACIAMAVLDGPVATNGTEGLWSDFQVQKFTIGQTVKGVQTVEVTIKPALNTAAGTNALGPQYVIVGTGSIIG